MVTTMLGEAALRRFFAGDEEVLRTLDETQPVDAPVDEPEPEAEPREVRRTVWDRSERERREDIYCAEYKGSYMDAEHSAVWNRWGREIATKAIDDLMGPEIQDIAREMTSLAADLDAVIDECAALRRELEAMRASMGNKDQHGSPS